MAAVNPPLYLDQDAVYGAADLGLPYRDIMGEGVVGTNDLLVSAGSGLNSSTAAGAAWVTGDDDVNTQPCYRVRNDAAVTIAHDAADPTNPRIDLVIAEVLDATFSGVSKLWRLRAIKGTPAGSPASPALPSNAIALAEVRVNAGSGTISSVTDRRVKAHIGGGSVGAGPKITTSVMSGGPPSSPSDGDIWIATGVGSNGERWSFQYNAGSGSAFKWELFGGSEVLVIDTSGSGRAATADSTWQDWPTVPLSITLPRAGDYLIRYGCGYMQTTNLGNQAQMSINIAGSILTACVLIVQQGAALGGQPDYAPTGTLEFRSTGRAASDVVKVQIWSNLHGQTLFSGGLLAVIPIRIS